MTQQGNRQAAFRSIANGSALTYDGDLIAAVVEATR